MNSQQARKRRGLKTKAIIRNSKKPRMVVHRSTSHMYAQIVVSSDAGDIVLASASTVDKTVKSTLKGNKTEQAAMVGHVLATRAKEKNVTEVAFDRAGYKYHGRVKAVADAARAVGLIF